MHQEKRDESSCTGGNKPAGSVKRRQQMCKTCRDACEQLLTGSAREGEERGREGTQPVSLDVGSSVRVA